VGTGITGTGSGPLNTAPVSGTLARTGPAYGFELQGSLRTGPAATGRDPSLASSEVLHTAFQAATPWPEQDPKVFPNAAERTRKQAAISWIGLNAKPTGVDSFPSTSNPRGQYWTLPYASNAWDKIAYAIQALDYSRVSANDQKQFTKDDLEWAKAELAGSKPPQVGGEIGWLQATHSYLGHLATPFADGPLKDWTQLKTIANEINGDVGANDSAQVAVNNWLAVFDFARSVASNLPGISEAVYVANDTYDLAMQLTTETNGQPVEGDDDFPTTVDKVGQNLVDRLGAAQGALTRQLPNTIAADYGKLKTIGACSSQDQDNCPFNVKNWQYTQDDQARASKALLLGGRAWAYGQLLPARYTLFSLPSWWQTKIDDQFHSRSPYCCRSYPFDHLPATAQFAKPNYRNIPHYSHALSANADLEWSMTGGSDRWNIYAVGHLDRAGSTFDPYVMQYPGAKVTNELFSAPPDGLGVDPETFFDTQFDGPGQTVPLEHYPTRGSDVGWCLLQFSCN
jgi:hypothetical protein